ncbi:protein tonB [Luteimonas deserti]|uniref:Protein tonB n=1 Tax=Luteimonas deserti TaxID=2752306 RepID=A0A7Z0TYI0_9GAMM|nr:protein tonB [Luteimonas deserti]NYZ61148.1 protein tonB [Luteimonas deserti]
MNRFLAAALVAVSLAGVAPDADAQTARQARQEVEASMLVTGHVDIDAGGGVIAHAVDEPGKLPPHVVALIDRFVPSMRFEPVTDASGSAPARAKMALRLVATPAGNGEMNMRIASAHFGDKRSEDDPSEVRAARMVPPRYPQEIAMMGGTGTVYLLIKVGRDGSAQDVVAEQVNLTALGTGSQMQTIRTRLAKAAIDAAKRWQFTPPTEGLEAERSYWVVRTPVTYSLDRAREPAYGTWGAYHPGPRTSPDWAAPTPEGFSPDAVAAGGLTPETSRYRLVTPLEG